ncbi:hypothetical protein PSYMO_37262, partial [Pseudomonas amygdali pv. mori str. 301020]
MRLAAEGYNRIPLARETLADFDAPRVDGQCAWVQVMAQ